MFGRKRKRRDSSTLESPLTQSSDSNPGRSDLRMWREAELAVATWLRGAGLLDAAATQGVRDGGIDVVATGYICQVKRHRQPLPAAALQQLVGAAAVDGSLPLFFSSFNMDRSDRSGYSTAALRYADQVGLACFVFDAHRFDVSPVNAAAVQFLNEMATRSQDPAVQAARAEWERLGSKRRQSRRRRRKRRKLEQSIATMVADSERTTGG